MPRRSVIEGEKIHFQSNRFVFHNGEWFYLTRDCEERRPFVDKAGASGKLILYLRHIYNRGD